MPFRRHPSIVLLSLTIFVASFALTLAAPAADDDTYLLELESADADATLDRSRLSLLLDDVRGRLWASRGAVRRLQSTIDVTTDRSIRVSLGSEYAAHDEALVAMKLALPALLEDPLSVDLLFDVLRSGEKACWHLTRYRRVAESYGSLPEYQAAVAPAAEACRKLGRAGFSAPVRAALVEGLAQDSERDDQLGELREEIAALEELFEDLRRIEAADP